ncbi:MAG: hypothetical protein AAF824_00005 [Bacteroidota bacterium]
MKALASRKEQEVIAALMYQGEIAAIKLYMKYANCRLRDAKIAVEKLGQEIEPGPAS